jgi:hypothetical protein
VLARERVLSTGAHKLLLGAERDNLVALAIGNGKDLTLYRGSALASLESAGTSTLEAQVSRAALYGDQAGVELALVDERGQVLLAPIAAAGLGKPQLVATGADRRFAPALARLGDGRLVAFVRAVGEGMHTFVALVHGAKVTLHDVTPEGHGAAAPAFVAGASEPTLVMLDARAGVSPLLELGFDAQGHPGEVMVRTPVSQPYAPPLLRAVELPDGQVEVAFTAVGKLAATAIGRVPLRRAVQALALLPSRGYGELSFSALRGARRAAFAYEAPRTSEAGSAHDVEVVLLDEQGLGPVLSLGASDDARAPELALYAGTLWLGYTRGSQAVVAALRCDLD